MLFSSVLWMIIATSVSLSTVILAKSIPSNDLPWLHNQDSNFEDNEENIGDFEVTETRRCFENDCEEKFKRERDFKDDYEDFIGKDTSSDKYMRTEKFNRSFVNWVNNARESLPDNQGLENINRQDFNKDMSEIQKIGENFEDDPENEVGLNVNLETKNGFVSEKQEKEIVSTLSIWENSENEIVKNSNIANGEINLNKRKTMKEKHNVINEQVIENNNSELKEQENEIDTSESSLKISGNKDLHESKIGKKSNGKIRKNNFNKQNTMTEMNSFVNGKGDKNEEENEEVNDYEEESEDEEEDTEDEDEEYDDEGDVKNEDDDEEEEEEEENETDDEDAEGNEDEEDKNDEGEDYDEEDDEGEDENDVEDDEGEDENDVEDDDDDDDDDDDADDYRDEEEEEEDEDDDVNEVDYNDGGSENHNYENNEPIENEINTESESDRPFGNVAKTLGRVALRLALRGTPLGIFSILG